MAEVTIQDLLDAQKTIIDTVPGVGAVLTRERSLDEKSWISLFTALNSDRSARGVMILWQQLVSQTKGNFICTVQQRHRFSYEILEPFDDAQVASERSSREVFIDRIEAINNALNKVEGEEKPWALGIDSDFPASNIEHQFLQSDEPISVRLWSTGPLATKTHYASFTLDVLCTVKVHEP